MSEGRRELIENGKTGLSFRKNDEAAWTDAIIRMAGNDGT